jgi:hypothetical protein
VSSSGHFSVTTAGGFVLGGIAAVVLATVIALGGYGRSKAPSPASAASGAAGAAGEYLLDVSDVKDIGELPR